ncbi:Piso0_004970 [Millerozyma farinosa CBS 7064]|uniref:Piso0_004970 protein n=1 Tax=Pichia sorbitophila (strain ATCC MYA-4447 / BCRC 22081 / CBS 7064 / NBRC 10061 / NRRL Y-12695) TaxID=559304 RepID=G8Y0X5_PICSO|nr:Piso0_004970 [Millerozyma farinosa CBS 7064]
MSFVVRRQLSTLIPPKIASAKSIGSNPNAKRMTDVVSFYKKLPTGQAPAPKKPTSPLGKYRAAYFEGENASGKPLLHLALAVVVLGYTWEYQSHLKHHKEH